MRVRRARTSWVTSFTIFALAFCDIVWYHFDRRTLPVNERSWRAVKTLGYQVKYFVVPCRETRSM